MPLRVYSNKSVYSPSTGPTTSLTMAAGPLTTPLTMSETRSFLTTDNRSRFDASKLLRACDRDHEECTASTGLESVRKSAASAKTANRLKKEEEVLCAIF